MTPVKRKEPEEDDEFGPSWIPMGLKIVRNSDGSVDVTEISDEVIVFFPLYKINVKKNLLYKRDESGKVRFNWVE